MGLDLRLDPVGVVFPRLGHHLQGSSLSHLEDSPDKDLLAGEDKGGSSPKVDKVSQEVRADFFHSPKEGRLLHQQEDKVDFSPGTVRIGEPIRPGFSLFLTVSFPSLRDESYRTLLGEMCMDLCESDCIKCVLALYSITILPSS